MRMIIAGSRTVTDYEAVAKILDRRLAPERGVTITEVVSGGARGVDTLAERWATERGYPVKRFPADWSRFGRSAGMIRNRLMAKYAAASVDGPGGLLAVWDGQSPGTRGMIDTARGQGMLVDVYLYPEPDAVQDVASGSDTPGEPDGR